MVLLYSAYKSDMPLWELIYLPSLQKTAAIIGGSLLISIGINFFLIPFKVLDGGLIGIGLIINYLFGAKVGLVMLFCSIPIFLLAWFQYRGIVYNSLYGLVISSVFIDLLVPLHYYFMYYIELTSFSIRRYRRFYYRYRDRHYAAL
jgi:uncharacterized membrane-anchored protein YitT (DUF2179 family)